MSCYNSEGHGSKLHNSTRIQSNVCPPIAFAHIRAVVASIFSSTELHGKDSFASQSLPAKIFGAIKSESVGVHFLHWSCAEYSADVGGNNWFGAVMQRISLPG